MKKSKSTGNNSIITHPYRFDFFLGRRHERAMFLLTGPPADDLRERFFSFGGTVYTGPF